MKFIKITFVFTLICMILGVTTIFGFYFYLKPQFPNVAVLKDVELQTPMQVFSQEGKLIAQFGEKRRIPVQLEAMPQELIDAIIATEDTRFHEHFGFDPIGITRAAVTNVVSGRITGGASTITQQLARNFFLSNEQKIMRKIKEIFIAIHIEQLLTKDEILELYLNKIYLGHRSYGVGAAAQVYFGKELNDLTIGELAVIAGLPKAPSTMNPIYSVDRATTRRNVVLLRMLDEQKITQEEFETARAEVLDGRAYATEIEISAPYVAEIARSWMVDKYGDKAYTSGMRVFTTVKADLQSAANESVVNNLLNYDERHGYRGKERTVWEEGAEPLTEKEIKSHLRTQPSYGEIRPAVVLSVGEDSAEVFVKSHGVQTLSWEAISWARKFLTDEKQGPAPELATDILLAGEQVWVRPLTKEVVEVLAEDSTTEAVEDENAEVEIIEKTVVTAWKLGQIPKANSAFVAINPENGQVISLVGGFNFAHNKFNRVTQSVRQVGSSIKPFIYAAAIDDGLTLASLINDTPINQWDASEGTAWRPKNSPPTYMGPTRLRIGLAQSKNVMAVRVLRHVGLDETRDYLARFGFEKGSLPRSETIALGAGNLTPLQMAQGYAVFANGGYYVEPYVISRVETPYGETLFEAVETTICKKECETIDLTEASAEEIQTEFESRDVSINEIRSEKQYAPRVISLQTAFLTREMMYANVWGGGNWAKGTGWNGTGFRAQALKRRDVGGKTGTTNGSKDAWYSGYGPGVVAVSWVGFDDHTRTLGRSEANKNLDKKQVSGGEAGAKTAQPAWVDFMQVALADTPIERKKAPRNIFQARIDRETGLLTYKTDETSRFEYFIAGTEPTEYIAEEEDTTDYSDDFFLNDAPEDSEEESADDEMLF